MFNLSGSEIVFLLLLALIVLGPEKLPEAVRKFGKVYAEVKKMSSGFQSELKSALDEPMREMRETADAIKKAAKFEFTDDYYEQTPVDPEAEADAAELVEPVEPVEPEEVDQPTPAETAAPAGIETPAETEVVAEPAVAETEVAAAEETASE